MTLVVVAQDIAINPDYIVKVEVDSYTEKVIIYMVDDIKVTTKLKSLDELKTIIGGIIA